MAGLVSECGKLRREIDKEIRRIHRRVDEEEQNLERLRRWFRCVHVTSRRPSQERAQCGGRNARRLEGRPHVNVFEHGKEPS